MPVTVYLILATVYCIFDIGQKGPMQFIGSLEHYFTPGKSARGAGGTNLAEIFRDSGF